MSIKQFTYEDVVQARNRVASYVMQTALDHSIYLSDEGHSVYFKLENQQPVKSFKLRGALNRILQLTEEEKEQGIAAISSGNHGVAVAYSTKLLGLKPATIIVPETTPKSKVEKIRYYGGNVVLMGSCYDDAHVMGTQYTNEHHYVIIDGGDEDPIVFAGQGTIALEMLRQNPDIDTILLPIGGGGLGVGCAVAAKGINPNIKVIAVYTEACTAWIDSIRDGKPYYVYDSAPSICEAMIGGVGKLGFEMVNWIDGFIGVSEESIRKAIVHMLLNEKVVVEATSAAPVAAWMEKPELIPGKNIGIVISGGNADNQIIIDELKKL